MLSLNCIPRIRSTPNCLECNATTYLLEIDVSLEQFVEQTSYIEVERSTSNTVDSVRKPNGRCRMC